MKKNYRLFYCPKCKKEEIRKDNPYKTTLYNIRDGYGRPIQHYKCECGNYLAGSIDISDWIDNIDINFYNNNIEYCKIIIKNYNEGGYYYNADMLNKIRKE